MNFQSAKVVRLFEIDGELYRRVPAKEGIQNPTSIRASLPIRSGPDAGGIKICWFVKHEPVKPPTEPASSEVASGNPVKVKT